MPITIIIRSADGAGAAETGAVAAGTLQTGANVPMAGSADAGASPAAGVTSGAAPADAEPRLTFDGDRVVIGRGSGCDVRLPDPSVTLRHASVRATLAEYTLVDEGSSNGTFVGGVRLPPHTPRTLRNGDLVRVGRVWLEVRIEQVPPTADLAMATRDMAMAFVSRALRKLGADITPKVRVAEGRDAGRVLFLSEEARVYVVGRSETCDLPLLDPDVSREHAQFFQRGNAVFVRDLGSKNGVVAAGARLPEGRDVPFKSGVALRIGKTTLVLEEPVAAALVEVERLDDQPVQDDEIPPPPSSTLGREREGTGRLTTGAVTPGSGAVAGTTPMPPSATGPRGNQRGKDDARQRGRSGWTAADLAVMAAALVVLALSVAGLIWLLRS